MQTLVDRIADKIAAIPASGGSVMELHPSTLRHKLSRDLIRRIAEVAANEAANITLPGGSDGVS